jgi:16S rRNA (uracil1498-N3)-methyltransferase
VVLEADGRVRVIDRHVEPAAPGSTIACGVPEGERADWLIEKGAELGVGAFQPIDTARARWRPERSRLERWQRLARAALGQSQGAWLLEVRAPVPWTEFVASIRPGTSAWLADSAGHEGLAPARTGVPWLGAVGPSSGFDEREKEALMAAGFRPIRLSSRRLRTETAAVGLAALWSSTQSEPA